LASVTVIVTFGGVKFRLGIGHPEQGRERRLLQQHLIDDVVFGVEPEFPGLSAQKLILVPPARDFEDLLVDLVAAVGVAGLQIEAEGGGHLGEGGAAREAVEAVTVVEGSGGVGVSVEVAGVTEEEIVGGAADGGGGVAVGANLEADVLEGEGVSGVDVVVAEETEFGGVGSAEE